MANAQGISVSFLSEAMKGEHQVKSGGHTLNMALYYSTGTVNKSTTAYTATSEVTGTNYVAKGSTVTLADPATSGAVAYWTPGANVSWGTLTASDFNCTLLFNDTHASDASIGAFTFGNQTVTAGNFTLTMPTNNSDSALIRLTSS